MLWRQRRARRRAAEQARWDGRVGAHRLRNGDQVPYRDGRTWRDFLATQEHPVINRAALLTPGQEHRSRKRRWL
jgi:hypothetical protein